MYDGFEKLDVTVIAIAQEDKDLKTHARFLTNFKPKPRFEIVADLSREATDAYGRTSTYLIDKDGVVRQVFPQVIHHRAHWDTILQATKEELQATDETSQSQPTNIR